LLLHPRILRLSSRQASSLVAEVASEGSAVGTTSMAEEPHEAVEAVDEAVDEAVGGELQLQQQQWQQSLLLHPRSLRLSSRQAELLVDEVASEGAVGTTSMASRCARRSPRSRC
jgi:hypothetical protein